MYKSTSLWVPLALCLALLGTPSSSSAQAIENSSTQVALKIDSGWVENLSMLPAMQNIAAVVYSQIVQVPNVSWLRLQYANVQLSGEDNRKSYLRITSLFDKQFQTQNQQHVREWRDTSAYFNGDAVRIEILAFPNTGKSRIHLDAATVSAGRAGVDTICGPTDDRKLSQDKRVGRNQPTGCTSWMIQDCNKCFLTAGHCSGSGLQVVEFNVPLSTSGGSIQHPGPQDQYAVDSSSVQDNGGQGTGNDWAYFGVFPNTNTGLTPYAAAGNQAFILDPAPPAVSGQNIRITGNGSTSSPVSPTWYLVQKTHAGPYFSFSGSTVKYTTDTTGGNSGSPVIDDSTGHAIGIHTHGGCGTSGGSNTGTGSNHAGLQAALANPKGVCDCKLVTFTTPNGLPTGLDPNGGSTIRVVAAAGTGTPKSGTGQLHINSGGGFQVVPMTSVGTNTYDAVFPSLPCGSNVNYYFSVGTVSGQRASHPDKAPGTAFSAIAVTKFTTFTKYNFNTAPTGWSVTNQSLATGAWTRATPSGNGSRRDPARDHDGSGQCWITGNSANEDVDGGPTILTTETFNLSSSSNPFVSYARWISTDGIDDYFTAEISENGGQSWKRLERLSDQTGWNKIQFRILDFVTNLSQIKFRFSVADNPNDSVTEGGLDAFEVFEPNCGPNQNGSYSVFGLGCTGAAGQATLTATATLPNIGQGFTVLMSGLPASSSALGLIGFSKSTFGTRSLPLDLTFLGMPSCTLYTDIADAAPTTNFAGIVIWTIQLPNDPGLIGLKFYQQGWILDPAANALGAVTTNAGEGIIGR